MNSNPFLGLSLMIDRGVVVKGRVVGYWKCPYCGWVVTSIAYLTIRFDPGCPKCRCPWAEFNFIGQERGWG